MSGWLIKVTDWDNSEPARLFAVALGEPHEALVAVQKLTGAAPKLRVETVGQLSLQTIRLLGLDAGQVLALTN